MLPRSCRVVPGLQLHCSGKDSWGLVLAQMKKKKIGRKTKTPLGKGEFHQESAQAGPALRRGSGPGPGGAGSVC